MTSALVLNHLWQSTVFAALAAVLALAFRNQRAQVRYWLWFAASMKFLIPVSLLVTAGSQVQWRSAPVVAAPAQFSAVVDQISQPFDPPTAAIRTKQSSSLAQILPVLWACGAIVVLLGWTRRWLRFRRALRGAKPLALDAPVRAMSTPARIEPGVFGIFRPLLLVPEGIADRLTPAQWRAILAHELSHVRRRDNLTAAMHMAVEALFWFHPLVWWIGRRLIAERERACDEAVLLAAGDPQDYAEGIIHVCKLYFEAPLPCVSGVTGADLRRRIREIMTARVARDLHFAKKAGLSAAGIAALAVPILIGALHLHVLRAQEPKPAFDVASVKPAGDTRLVDFRITGGKLVSTNWSLAQLVRQAYAVQFYQVTGGPAWFDSDRFNIEGDSPGEPSREQMMDMLRTLLEDRFKLKVHREIKEGTVYALTVGKNGHKLKPANPEDQSFLRTFRKTPPTEVGVSYYRQGQNASLAQLTEALSAIVRAPVSDRTGLTGNFDFRFDYAIDDAPPEAGPRIAQAVQDDLGLKLEKQKGPVETLVIDHAEKPSAN